MADFVIRVGSSSAQGVRPNNEDSLVVDLNQNLFLVADGMGGQAAGEIASGMAADIIPRALRGKLSANAPAEQALQQAIHEAHQAIVEAGKNQPEGRRMGTTAVCALQRNDHLYICSLGDSRAYLIRDDKVEQLTVDHSVAFYLFQTGILTRDEARCSPYSNVLHKFLGCASMQDQAEVKPLTPQAGDRLLLATDGLTNFIQDEDLLQGTRDFENPQEWADHLVSLALKRGSRDNVTCIVVAFQPA